MFRKTIVKLGTQHSPQALKELLALPLHNDIKDAYVSNDSIIDGMKLPYELRGEYLPRRKINPFKKKPLSVIYDQSQFNKFVLPSKRTIAYGFADLEELFGVRKWRNDSPFIKEYIKIDNQIMLIAIVGVFFYLLIKLAMLKEWEKIQKNVLTSEYGVFTAKDLI